MNQSDPKSVRIRLEIDVPNAMMAARREQDDQHDRYVSTTPGANGLSCVRPVSGSVLGTFTFKAVYLFPRPNHVKALGYPASIYPGFNSTSSCPGPAVLGEEVSPGEWVWNDTYSNRVPGGDHNSMGVMNKVTVWKDYGLGFIFDGAVTVRGVTEGQGSCSGSGSNSAMEAMEELAAADTLLVTVRGGPYHGDHLAKRTAGRTWTVDLGKERWEITTEPPGRLVIRTRSKTAESKRIEVHPFMAVLPAAICGAEEDVLVTVR